MRSGISDAAATLAASTAVVDVKKDWRAVDVRVATAVEGQSEAETTEVDGIRSACEEAADSVDATGEDRRC